MSPSEKNRLMRQAGFYLAELANKLNKVDLEALIAANEIIDSAESIFVGGNGGSAAISNHLECDFLKNRQKKVCSLVSNPAVLMMIANDYGYSDSIAYQVLRTMTKNDVLILISSSGNSPNVINAAQAADYIGIKTIALTGFDGGKLADLVDVNINVNSTNYGIVEDTHQAIMHILSMYGGSQWEIES